MTSSSPRAWLRTVAAAALCIVAAACATPQTDQAACEVVEGGLDPGCAIDRPLLKEAIASYRAHYNKMKVGQHVAVTEGGAIIPFVTHWLKPDRFVVVDFSKPAYEKRLFVVNWKTGLVQAYHVSHGRGSAESDRSYKAKRFTNLIGSGTSSVGAYVAGQEYLSPRWGRAIRLQGLDHTNSRALERTIVFHSNEQFFDRQRNVFGWSCGCFMMDESDLPHLIQVMENGGFVYAGPAALFDKSTASKVRECNPYCGDQDRCSNTVAAANPIGSLPGVAAPAPLPDAPPPMLVPNPLPGEIPVPLPKPRQVITTAGRAAPGG